MYSICYSFQVKPNQNKTFEEAWFGLTELIYLHAGSLGSRLHKVSDSSYFTYSQWPCQAVFELERELPKQAAVYSTQMRNACEEIQTVMIF